MKIPEKFKEYIWLINTIRKSGRITFTDLQNLWLNTEMSGGIELAKATFHRHREAIEDIFGLYIDCDRKHNFEYFICNDYVLHDNSVQNWMLATLSVNNIISESLSLQNRILLEQAPCDDYLKTVIDAMKQKVRIEVTYRRYGSDTESHSIFEPYCIKLFRQRWYILGHFHRDAVEEKPESDYFAIFSFDRIIDMNLTDIKFEIDPKFDAEGYFNQCWGVFIDDNIRSESIIVRAFGKERYYIKDLPLHWSQHSIGTGDNYEDFELHLKPTNDFCGHILSRCNQLKVIYPETLVERIHGMLKDSLAMYE